MRHAAFSLFERGYHVGFAGLCNSLHANEFRDTAVGLYRGKKPAWLDVGGTSGLVLPSGMNVRALEYQGTRHFTYCKPLAAIKLFDEHPELEYVYYFDPDIVVTRLWEFFNDWASNGVGLVMDPILQAPSAPIWQALSKWAKGHGFEQRRPVTHNVNGGFFCVSRKNREFLEVWAALIDAFLKDYPDCEKNLSPAMSRRPFSYGPDQDLMALATSMGDWPLSIGGLHEMGFHWGVGAMQHAIGSPKPWMKGFLRVLRERKACDLAFYQYSGYPVRVQSALRRRLLLLPYRFLGTRQ